MTARIFIDGEHGTTGLAIRERLAGRSDFELISLPVTERRNEALRLDSLQAADIAILCLPDDAARQIVGHQDIRKQTRIIDASSAHRTDPDFVYGFAEMEDGQAERIADAAMVSNPGCFSTGAIALLHPLVKAGVLAPTYPVTINAVSGYSGGGKQLIAQMEGADQDDPITAPHFIYALDLTHKHLPEIVARGGLSRPPVFTPSVGRFRQGMIVQVPLHMDNMEASPSMEKIRDIFGRHYEGQAHIDIVSPEAIAEVKRIDPTEMNGTDDLRIYLMQSRDGRRMNAIAVLDNLGKGAAGAAVQNLDLMLAG